MSGFVLMPHPFQQPQQPQQEPPPQIKTALAVMYWGRSCEPEYQPRDMTQYERAAYNSALSVIRNYILDEGDAPGL